MEAGGLTTDTRLLAILKEAQALLDESGDVYLRVPLGKIMWWAEDARAAVELCAPKQ